VKVYADGAGVRNIELRNAQGTVIQNANINIADGESRITLNFNVPAGADYQLAGPGDPYLYRNNGGCAYPYNIGGMAVITESSAGTNPTGYYYYFYDWEVSQTACTSERLKVSAWINSGDPVASFTSFPYALHCNFTSTSVDANEYLWDFGDGATSILANPIHIYSAPGQYPVTLTVTNACGTDMTNQTVNILATATGEENAQNLLQIIPNPASDRIRIYYPVSTGNEIIVRIADLTGKDVMMKRFVTSNGLQNEVLDLSNLSKGTYILNLSDGKTNSFRRIVLQ